ncbi:hypothetical protein TVAG_213110 [Trichomonas vaginalis G3]|uniref:Uncharacterized protein n=1 Tax=Trichomonas vaginalis (strain ATCC PRA-98 / G3) TaxID=412133 RepID=A2EET6_TRIV3|nr:hypothetical protein TVAGG3_0061230 [Trichomonas vaginalis G3]EAY08802.1 hypothetical protein TVAG_213110 [Trichomonas vaginalis G3]KAI5542022.1 hypothetical protein TVAGG3_0061230 [Trichomonas vaginalis G3]|eukprot:XP_001321025.1 hypothetical protein [Trichomonas vaginalis G3]
MNDSNKKVGYGGKSRFGDGNSRVLLALQGGAHGITKPESELSRPKNTTFSYSGQTFITPAKPQSVSKSTKNSDANTQAQSLFPKLKNNAPQKIEKESFILDVLPPIPLANTPESSDSSKKSSSGRFLSPTNEEMETYTLPSGFEVSQKSPPSPKIKKFDPFQPIEMSDNTPNIDEHFQQVRLTAAKTTLSTPLHSANSNFVLDESSSHYSEEDQYSIQSSMEDNYIPPPPPNYGPIKPKRGPDGRVTIPLALQYVPPQIPDDDNISKVPPRLLELLHCKTNSVQFLVLSGVPVDGYRPKLIKKAISDLQELLEICIKKGYAAEAKFVDDAIKNAKADLNERLATADVSEVFDVEDQISEVQTEMEQKKHAFESHLARMDAEAALQKKELQLKLDDDLDAIDSEWTSPSKSKKFSRVSAKLQNMRKEAMTLLNAKRYEEAERVNQIADKLAEEEALQAQEAMKAQYMKCLKKRQEQYESEIMNIDMAFERKKLTMIKDYKAVQNALNKRMDKLQTKKESITAPTRTMNSRKSSKIANNDQTLFEPSMQSFKDINISPTRGLAIKPLSKIRRTTITRRNYDQ